MLNAPTQHAAWPLVCVLIACLILVRLVSADIDLNRVMRLAQERYGASAARTVADWETLLAGLRDAEEDRKLDQVNTFFNRNVRFEDDVEVWRKSDYWATPLEFMGRGAGDCEDFTIAKYVTLLLLGVPNERLRLIYVKARIGGPMSDITEAHMVLGYFASPGSEPLVLDNLIGDIRPASRRPDLFPVFSFNNQGLWVGGPQSIADPSARLSRWRDLLARLKEDGLQ